MAEKKKDYRHNTVKIFGYVKENNLKQITCKTGNAITGSITISTDEVSSHKVQVWASEFNKKDGSNNETYSTLATMLPESTISIAGYLKENPSANYETAISAATKVWVIAHFDEYAYSSGERVSSSITVKCDKIGIAKSEKSPFTPKATFDVDIYINKISPEVNDEEVETGRLEIEGLVPKYDKSVDFIKFIAPTEDGIAEYISKKYKAGCTANIQGELINISQKYLKDEEEAPHFGRTVRSPQYETKFIREFRIFGGSPEVLKESDKNAISKAEITEGLAKREVKIEENGKRAAARAMDNPTSDSMSAFPKSSNSTFSDDMDF